MFRKLFVFILLALLVIQAKAQMGAAQKVHWDVDSTRAFNVPASEIWEAIKDPSTWAEISNGFISSITVTKQSPGQMRLVKFSDGSERSDIITQLEPQNKMIVLMLAPPLPAGINEGTIAFFVRSDDNGKGLLHISAIVKGGKQEKEKAIVALKNEVSGYLSGLAAKLAKAGN